MWVSVNRVLSPSSLRRTSIQLIPSPNSHVKLCTTSAPPTAGRTVAVNATDVRPALGVPTVPATVTDSGALGLMITNVVADVCSLLTSIARTVTV